MVRLVERAAAARGDALMIGHLLRTPLVTSPRQEIVHRDEYRGSYLDLRDRIGRLASALRARGVEEGATVAVLDWDSHRYLECYFAVPMMGSVLQTVNIRLSPEQIAYTLDHARAEVVLVHRDFAPLFAAIRPALPRVREVIWIGGGAVEACGYEGMLAAATVEFPFVDFDENALATTFYTTGTTGLPKAVSFTHRQIVLHTLGVLGALGSAQLGQSLRHGDVYMPLTPMFHVHAWGVPYVATLLGLKQVYPGRYEPPMLLQLRAREGVTYSHCVPTILQMLLDAADASGSDLAGWKINIGGSALTAALARRALSKGIDVFAAYGMSETCPYLTATRVTPEVLARGLDAEIEVRCRTGLPAPLVDLRLVDEQMHDVPRDGSAVGEIVVRAPWLTLGYVGDPAASEQLWRGGWLHTGDIASQDADGFVQIRDRMKDVIKTGGEWLSSLQIEDLIARHPGVAEVAVIGLPDERWGERPVALIVRRADDAGAALTAGQVREQLAPHVASGEIVRYAVPERIEFVAALARTSVGKIDKKAMRAERQ
jgi:fatty-acyl-CoA synthase